MNLCCNHELVPLREAERVALAAARRVERRATPTEIGKLTAAQAILEMRRQRWADHRAGHGDLDKHQRSVGDALVDAGVLADDALIVAWRTSKQWCGTDLGQIGRGMTHPIKFSPGNHQYRLDGKPVKGVTTLISGGLPKPALPRWAANTVAEYVADNPNTIEHLRTMGRYPMVNALKGVPWEQRDQAGARGTEVHRIGEQVVHGEEVDVPEHLLGHVEGYARFLDKWKVEPLLAERMVANREHWYAGTFDLIATVNGEPWMLDLKTSKGIYGEVALQVAAYRNAEFWQDEDGNEQPLPEVARIGALHVREDGTDLIPLDSSEAPFRCFLHVAWVAKQTDTIKGWVGEALSLDGAA